MRVFLIILMSLIVSVKAETLNPVFDREWSFSIGDGSVLIGLTYIGHEAPRFFSLTIVNKGVIPNISEEAKCLETVLLDIRLKGKGEKLWSIYLEFGGVNARELALAANESKEWEAADKSDYTKVVVHLLNSADVYAPFNDVLKPYGLTLRVGAAEYISLSEPNAFGLKAHNGRLLPSGASVQLVAKDNPAQKANSNHSTKSAR